MRISHKRAFLAGLLSGSGLLRSLETLARRSGLLVLGYHRIGTATATNGYSGVFSATAEDFRAQIHYLARRFRILTLTEVLNAAPDFAFNEPCVLITFDDGYRDNLDVAVPILKELGVPATFFLPTDFLDRPHLFWWDRLSLIFHKTSVDHIHLDEPVPIDIDLRMTSRDAAISSAVAPLLAAHPDVIDPWLDRLAERAQVMIDDEAAARSLLMGWDGARKLVDAGMSVGSHAASHRNLARLDENVQRDELVRSKAALESKLGIEANSLAYPYGVASAFSQTTRRIAEQAGYRVAFGFGGGINRPKNSRQFALARINVGSSDTFNLFCARSIFLSSFGRSVF